MVSFNYRIKRFYRKNLIKEFNGKYKLYCFDKENCDLKLKKFPVVDIVIHLAAFNSTKNFYNKPLEVIEDNLIPTLNLLGFTKTKKETFIYLYWNTRNRCGSN